MTSPSWWAATASSRLADGTCTARAISTRLLSNQANECKLTVIASNGVATMSGGTTPRAPLSPPQRLLALCLVVLLVGGGTVALL